jgi:hypothetical protein
LLAFVRDLAALDDPAAIVVFSIRTDSYDALERAKRLCDAPSGSAPGGAFFVSIL